MNIAHTGKSQASAIDIYSKIESQFLERYSRYVLKDECQGFLTDSQMQMRHLLDPKKISPQQLIQFKTHQINNLRTKIPMYKFSLLQRVLHLAIFPLFLIRFLINIIFIPKRRRGQSVLCIYDHENNLQFSIRAHQQSNPTQKKQLFYSYQPSSFNDEMQQVNFFELYSNKYATENGTLLQGEIIIFDCKIKCNSHRTKSLAFDIKKKIDFLFKSTKIQHQIIESEYLPYVKEYKYSSITIILMYNGDVNYDFSRIMNLNQITINERNFFIKVKIYFISKQSLFMYFKESNGQQKIDCINDRVITFYDMNRTRQQRTKILKEIDSLKRDLNRVSQQNKIVKEKEKRHKQLRFR